MSKMRKMVYVGCNLLGVLAMARRANKMHLIEAAFENVGEFANNVLKVERELGIERADWDCGAVELECAPPSKRVKRTHSLRGLIQWTQLVPHDWLASTGNAYIVASLHKGAGKNEPLLGAWALPKYVQRGSKAARTLHKSQVLTPKQHPGDQIFDEDWVVVDPDYIPMCDDYAHKRRVACRKMGRGGPPLQLPAASAGAVAAKAAAPTEVTINDLQPRKKTRRVLEAQV